MDTALIAENGDKAISLHVFSYILEMLYHVDSQQVTIFYPTKNPNVCSASYRRIYVVYWPASKADEQY